MVSQICSRLSRGCASVLLLGNVTLSGEVTRLIRESKASVTSIRTPSRCSPSVLDDLVGLPGDLDIKSESFDIVISAGWHEYAQWFRWSIQEIARVLKKDGVCLLAVSTSSTCAVGGEVAASDRGGIARRLLRRILGLGQARRGRLYPRLSEVVEELGLRVEDRSDAPVRRLLGRVSFEVGCVAAVVDDFGQRGASMLLCRKTEVTWPSASVFSDPAKIEAVIKRDFSDQIRSLANFRRDFAGTCGQSPIVSGVDIEASRVLVMSPHPDDELIGLGGTIMDLRRRGISVTVLHMSNGCNAAALAGAPAAIRRTVRLAEASKVAEELDVTVECWSDIDDGKEVALQPLAMRLVRLLDRTNPDVIFVPFANDPHPDHVQANRILHLAIAAWNPMKEFKILSYEVWTFCPYNLAVDISAWSDRKFALLAAYRTALRAVNYARTVQWIGAWHSLGAFGHAGQAEVFLCQSAAEYDAMVVQMLANGWAPQIGIPQDERIETEALAG